MGLLTLGLLKKISPEKWMNILNLNLNSMLWVRSDDEVVEDSSSDEEDEAEEEEEAVVQPHVKW